MKNFCTLVALAVVAFVLNGMSAQPVDGRPQYKKQFEQHYKESKIAAAAKEAKCNVCHYGKTKKNRNDYGKTLAKTLNKDLFKALKGDKEALNKKVSEVLKAAEKEKSSGGETFGKLIEAGKLPGTAPKE